MGKLFAILIIGMVLLGSCNKSATPKQEEKPIPGAVNFDSVPLPNDIEDVRGYKDNEGIYCAGFLDGRFWVGIYDNKYNLVAQRQIEDIRSVLVREDGDSIQYVSDGPATKNEWMVPAIQSNTPVYVSKIKYTDSSYFQIFYKFDMSAAKIDLIKTHMITKGKKSFGTYLSSAVMPWFEGSYLFNGWSQAESGERKTFVKILDPNFNRLYEFFTPAFTPLFGYVAVSYTEYLISFGRNIHRENLPGFYSVWETDILQDAQRSSRIDSTTFDIDAGAAVVKVYLTNSDISKETHIYKIDINTGRLL